MKFISKSANLHIILKPGIPAQPITGSPAVPTLSVRFQDGVVDIKDQELIERMQMHPGFNSDFIMAADDAHDPYATYRQPNEPAHVVTEMRFGTPGKRSVEGKVGNIPPELEKMIKDQAIALAKQIAPQLAKQILEEMVAAKDAASEPTVEETPVSDNVSVGVSDAATEEKPKATTQTTAKGKK